MYVYAVNCSCGAGELRWGEEMSVLREEVGSTEEPCMRTRSVVGDGR